MTRFQDTNNLVLLRNAEGQEFSCPSADFALYEPTYQPVTTGQGRIWDEHAQRIAADGNQRGDAFYTPERFALYLDKIAVYQVLHDVKYAPQLPSFEQRQAAAIADWNAQVNAFISQYYDTGTQISFIKIYLQNDAARPLIEQVDAWVSAVMAYYYTIKMQLQAAAEVAALNQLQPAMEFESRFGGQGNILPAPSVKLSDFF